MDQHAYLGDPRREFEIHRLLDQIAVPDESISDASSDIMLGRSTYEPESQVFHRGMQSPGRHHEDFFENSINSTIAHTSPLSNMHLNEDSKMDSSLSQNYTRNQESRIMDWSKNHITPAEGIFPQVSAPSMSIEGDIWDSPQETPQHTVILRSHSSLGTHNQSKKSISNLPVLDLPTHEEKPSREVITFSPNNAEANWYFNPMQNSKRSSTNQSLKFPKNSFSTELMQGSALLAHAANHHFPSEISLSQVRDNAPIFDEIHRLKTELANIKVAFRSEQNMHEETKKELYQCSNALQEMENIKLDLEDKNAELDEKVKLIIMKQKSPESLEQLRGKSLELARLQIKELKNALVEKEKKIEDYKHALSQRNNIENNSAREKEIEDLTYEITKLRIVNNSQIKQIKELNEKLEKESKNKDNVNGEFRNILSDQDVRMKKFLQDLDECKQEIGEKTKEIERLNKNLKEIRTSRDNEEKAKNLLNDELEQAKTSLEILQKQVSGTSYERTNAGDYEFQINKVRALYEKKIDENKEELMLTKANSQRYENKIKDLEAQVARLMTGIHNTFDDEAKETIDMLQDELDKISSENKELNIKLLDYKNSERRVNDSISKSMNEKKELENQLSQKEQEFREQVRMLENLNNEYLRNLEILKSESKNYKDLLTQYEEELNKNRFAYTQQQQLNEKLKKQLDDIKQTDSSTKQSIREEFEQDMLRMKNSIQSLNAKSQFEKDELYQRLREKDQEISELKTELEESFKNNEDKLRMDLEFYKNKLEKEKEAEINKIKKIYNSQIATQTSFDYSNMRDEIRAQVESEFMIKFKLTSINEESARKQMILEIKEKLENEHAEKLGKAVKAEKENYERKIEEIKNDYTKKLESIKSDYNKNTAKMEQEFMNKVKSMEQDYEIRVSRSKDFDKTDEFEKKLRLKEEELIFTQRHLKEVEQGLAETQKNLLLKQTSILSSQEELESIISRVKEDTKRNFDREKSDLFQSFDQEKKDLVYQNEKLVSDLKKKIEIIDEFRIKEKKMASEQEEKLEELSKTHLEEIEDYKSAFSKDMKDTEKAFAFKEKKLEREFNDKIKTITQEFEEKLLKEQEKYSEMMSKKDILSKADNQRVKDEVASLIGEKEREIQESFNKKQKVIKANFDKELRDKENEIESLKDSLEAERRKVKEELNEKINNLKQEVQRNKREYERETKKLTQQVENSMETARKELESQHQETLTKEKAEWERKEKNKSKLLQNKCQKDMQDREKVLKSEFEIEKSQALEEQAELLKKKIKQVQDDSRKYYEDLSSASLKEKIHEVELKVRRELQDNYLKTISQLDSQHFQEKEKMREEFRQEMSKRIEEIRSSSLVNQEESYFDMPFSAKKLKQSIEDSQELKLQVQSYKQKLEKLEQERELGQTGEPEVPKKVLETLKKYENELQSLSNEYKNYVLKSREWLESSNRKKEEWNLEKIRLEEKIQDLNERLSDSSAISPEMLSPEETSALVLGIFKRSNQNSLIFQLLQQNREFIEIVTNLIEGDSPRLGRHATLPGNRYEAETSLVSARSYSRPKSVDVELPGRPPHGKKLQSPISISQHYSPEQYIFPYGPYFSSS